METSPPVLPTLPPGESLSLPLGKITARFPQELATCVLQTPDGDLHIALPMAEIIEQLARGVVRVPFGIIRHAAPTGWFAETADFDTIPVTLPLEEILARLSPSQLPRRTNQRQVAVPETVAAPFRGNQTAPPASVVETAVPEAAPVVQPEVVPQPVVAPAPAAYTPVKFTAPTVIPTPATAVAAVEPASPPVNAPVPVRLVEPAAPVSAQPSPATEKTETSFFRANCLVLPLNRLVHNWPSGVVHEIAQGKLQGAQVELPAAQVEAGLKLGRLQFSWKQLRNWTHAIPTPHVESAHDAIVLELPLRIIAPLFLSQRPAQPRHRLKVGEGIPDLFGPTALSADTSSFRRTAAPAAPAPTPGASGLPTEVWDAQLASPLALAARSLPKLDVAELPTTPAVAAPAAVPAAPASPSTSFLARTTVDALFEEPGKTSWTPTELVRKTARLRGLAGVTMFTQDGLLIAEQYPALAGVDTYCALVTQMYNRVFSHAMELRLGGPTRMSFTAEGVTYETYKCGRVYLSVVSQPGEKLPSAELNLIADHLTRQSR